MTASDSALTGAQSLVKSLEKVGVDTVFGIPGGAILPAYDPLMDSEKIRHILVRHEQGALDLETIEARAVFEGEELRSLEQPLKNRARQLIEDLMIAANGVTARFLDAHGSPSLRRVLRSPER